MLIFTKDRPSVQNIPCTTNIHPYTTSLRQMSFLKQKCLDLLSHAFEHNSSDAKRLFKLTKESWDFDRRRASLIILERIFRTGAHYLETRIDASLFTQSLRILQRDPTFRKSHYAKIVIIKLCLTAMSYKADRYMLKVKIAMDAVIRQNRMLRLVASYLQLPYSQQVKEGTQCRYDNLRYQVSDNLHSFEETVGSSLSSYGNMHGSGRCWSRIYSVTRHSLDSF